MTVASLAVDDLGSLRISRFTASGQPDPGFGSGGVMAVATAHRVAGIYSMAERPDGGYLLLFAEETVSGTTLLGITAGGAVDPTWAPTAPVPGVLVLDQAAVVAVAADGAGVVVAGYFTAARTSARSGG